MSSNNARIDDIQKTFYGKWEGESKIVIGIDIGTTQSGVAYTYLQKGIDQSVHRVLSWPGQEDQGGHGKIPTLVWYDKNGKAVSFGAEATSPQAEEDAEDQGWQLAKYFKLHLHPSDLKALHSLNTDELPTNVPLGQIYADFLGYLLKHTQQFFEERILDGPNVWKTYKPTMDVVIAHPNGWSIREQTFLRNAAVAAGFTTEEQAPYTVHFVTEAEASVHFCMYYTTMRSQLKRNVNFAVCDAGGSTVDTTIYTVVATEPLLQLEERCASACIQAGGIFVDDYAKKYLERVLSKAGISSEEQEDCVKLGIKDFEAHAKRKFRETSTEQRIKVGSSRFEKPAIDVRRGSMKTKGTNVQKFFDPCVKAIATSVRSQLSSAGAPVPYVILVGGFGESPYLREQLKTAFPAPGPQVTYTNEATSKAVADGALIWRCVSSVVGRAPRYSFGVEAMAALNPNSKDHQGRLIVKWPTATFVKGVWSQIVTKGFPIDSDMVSRALSPEFQKVCSVTANLSNLRSALQPAVGPDGVQYWTLCFSICIRFGGTQLEAFVEWVKDGVTYTGPAKIIPSSELI